PSRKRTRAVSRPTPRETPVRRILRFAKRCVMSSSWFRAVRPAASNALRVDQAIQDPADEHQTDGERDQDAGRPSREVAGAVLVPVARVVLVLGIVGLGAWGHRPGTLPGRAVVCRGISVRSGGAEGRGVAFGALMSSRELCGGRRA